MAKLRLQQVEAQASVDAQIGLTKSQPHFSEENNYRYMGVHRRVWVMVLRRESQSCGDAVNSTGPVAELEHDAQGAWMLELAGRSPCAADF